MAGPMSGLDISENRAFVEKAVWYTICIVNLTGVQNESQRVFSEEIGTGTACLWKGQRIVLTAKHVLNKAGLADLAFLPRVGSAIDWDSGGKTDIAERVAVGVERIVRCQWEDLAAIVLRPGEAEKLNSHFCELPKKFARNLSGSGGVMLVGYPVDQACSVSKTKQGNSVTESFAVVATPIMGEVAPPPTHPLSYSYDPGRHLLIRFEPAEAEAKPFGYSGAGVWCDNVRSGAIWTADPLLVGVETSAFVTSKLLIAVRAEIVRQFLEESL
jgi:hypothetical protein